MANSPDKSPPHPPRDNFTPRDWFLPAIEANGSVEECLMAVIDDLHDRQSFIRALKDAIAGSKPSGIDAITDLGRQVKSLDNTLRFRLGILHPDRPGAWFRQPLATTGGPFATTLLAEPVFCRYDGHNVDRVENGLGKCWHEKTLRHLPFDESGDCLWQTLLRLNIRWHGLIQLPTPYDKLRLDKLPDGMPRNLESRALRAFLLNVQSEVANIRRKIDVCHTTLLETSRNFWKAQKQRQTKRQSGTSAPKPHNARAQQAREEFRKRRQSPQPILLCSELEALRYMGFEKLPTQEVLRERYRTMAKKLHPDLPNGNDAAFKTLTHSYKQLSARLTPRQTSSRTNPSS